MKNIHVLFLSSITVMVGLLLYAMHTQNTTLAVIAEVGAILDYGAYWWYHNMR